jgi:hypothetical protein
LGHHAMCIESNHWINLSQPLIQKYWIFQK